MTNPAPQTNTDIEQQLRALLRKYFEAKEWYDGETDQTIAALLDLMNRRVIEELEGLYKDVCNDDSLQGFIGSYLKLIDGRLATLRAKLED